MPCHISLFVTGKNHLGNSKSNCQPPELLESHGAVNEHVSNLVWFRFVYGLGVTSLGYCVDHTHYQINMIIVKIVYS